MTNRTEVVLGQEQTDTQYVLFSRHWHPYMSEITGEIFG